MKLYEYLKSHPGIRVSWLEKCLGLTHGTLRIGKIPKRHIEPIEVILVDYGYVREGVIKEVAPEDIVQDKTSYVTKSSVIGNWDGALFMRAPLKDGTVVEVRKAP
jgi:hypothetical protein